MPHTMPATTTAFGTDVERVLTPGGLEAWLVNAPSVPLLAVAFSFRGGAAADPAGSEGLSRMVAGLLDEGAGELDSLAFRTELEDLAIRLQLTAERDALAGRLMTLNGNRERAFELLRLALAEPRFDAEPIERIRQQITSDLQRRRTDPNTVAGRVWFAHAFPDHAYGRPAQGTPEAIRAVTRADLETYVASRLARDNLVIGVAGDITAAELAPLLDRAFAHLPAVADLPPLLPATPATGATLVTPMTIPQSVVTFGLPGIPRDDPDYYAAYVANYIIGGGGFASRLLEEVREKRGLAYSVYSHLVDAELAPLWMGGVATRNDQVAQSIEVIRAELGRMAEGDIGETDLANARTYLTGSFPLRFTSNESVARMLVGMQVADLGIDYLERRNALIEAVALADVARASERLFSAEPLFSVVGDPVGLDGATRLSPLVAANGNGGKG
ncbi:MAG: insulinase family protein [Geminicoccaceae bacterium]|nr:insulinase family protein [Geminicoccaceae bacterium]